MQVALRHGADQLGALPGAGEYHVTVSCTSAGTGTGTGCEPSASLNTRYWAPTTTSDPSVGDGVGN